MSSAIHLMLRAASDRTKSHVLGIALGAIVIASVSPAVAQEPPLTVPRNTLPAKADGIAIGDWNLLPMVRFYTVFSDNLFQSPVKPLSTGGLGLSPSLAATWSNGIHKTALYGTADMRVYPFASDFNIFDRQLGIAQTYEMRRDLIFTAQLDYSHATNASALQSVLPGPNSSPINPLPPGTIGTANTFVDPSNTYKGTASVYKILNRGFVRLTGSIARTDYEKQNLSQDFTLSSFNGTGGFWLGPVFYVFSDGAMAFRDTVGAARSSAYRAIGGIGTRQLGFFKGSIYFGRQGSEVEGSGTAGGSVFGALLTYLPTPLWTISVSADETINISNITSSPSLGQTPPGQSVLLIPINASTRVTSLSVQSDYKVLALWAVFARAGYTRADYIDSTQVDQAIFFSTGVKYDIWRNMALTLDYQFTRVQSTVPLGTSSRNYVSAGGTYRF